MSLYASVVNFQAQTSTGTQDITGSLGGENPKAALFFLTEKTTLADTPSTPFHFTMGMTDGTNEFYSVVHSETGVTTTDDYSAAYTDAVLRGLDGTGTQTYKAAFSTWITNGVRINWSDAAPSAFQGFVVLLGGSDLANAYVGTCDTGATVTDPGFSVNQVIMAAIGTGIASGTVANGAQMMFGMGLDTSTFSNSTSSNLGWSMLMRDGRSTSAPASAWEDACVISKIRDSAATGFDYNMTVGSWSASGFTTTSDNSNSDKIGYLALEWNSACDVRLEPFDNNNYTSTGVYKLDYGVSFGGTGTPALEMLSGCGSRSDSGIRNNNDPGTLHVSGIDGTNAYSVGGGVDDGVGTTATGSNASSRSLGVPNIFSPQSSGYQVKASFDSWAVDGVNHNFAAVAGGANFHYLGWVVVPSGLTANVVGTGLLDSQKLSRMRLAR